MDNRYNQELVERFRKREIILQFPDATKTRQDIADLQYLADKNRSGRYNYYEFSDYYNEIPHYSRHLPVYPLSDFINPQKTVINPFENEVVDVVVNTKEGLEKIVDDNLKDTIEMIESFNYEVRKLEPGEIRRGQKVWVRDNENEGWSRGNYEYLLYKATGKYSHVVIDVNANVFIYSFVTTSDPYAVPKLTRKQICDKFGIDNFEIVED